MRVYTHTACLAHDTGPDHAERSARLSAVTDALRAGLPALDWHEAPRATRGQLLRAHAPDLLDAVLALLQAAAAARQGAPRFGLPADFDPIEGWIGGCSVASNRQCDGIGSAAQ